MISRKLKVFVAMSGGVDSSTSAAMVKKAGYDVTGVFIKVWMPDFSPSSQSSSGHSQFHCEWKEDRRDAMRVAALLDIPFLTFNLEKEYKKEVVDYMIREYRAGRTPNPDVMCNQQIKFGSFFRRARKLGADFIATGHYARIVKKEYCELLEGSDKNKDQSYFLWGLTQKELNSVLFPIGNLLKEKVRKLAHKFKLPNAAKKDSQGLCFIGKVEMREFLKHFIKPKKGKVWNEKKEVVGEHDGAFFFTVGQRHGFKVNKKTPVDKAYYVVAKDVKKNILIVSNKKIIKEKMLAKNKCQIKEVNWINEPPKQNQFILARIRYRQQKQHCSLKKISTKKYQVNFKTPQEGLAAGQSLVIYKGEKCLGGGVIEI